jgi:hypothetical protein
MKPSDEQLLQALKKLLAILEKIDWFHTLPYDAQNEMSRAQMLVELSEK